MFFAKSSDSRPLCGHAVAVGGQVVPLATEPILRAVRVTASRLNRAPIYLSLQAKGDPGPNALIIEPGESIEPPAGTPLNQLYLRVDSERCYLNWVTL